MSARQANSKEVRRTQITRIRNSTKPHFFEKQPYFYRCTLCGEVLITALQRSEGLHVECCGRKLSPLTVNIDEALKDEHKIQIEFIGGFDANAAVVTVGILPHEMTQEHRIEWMYIYTFRGGQLKYFEAGQYPKGIFAFAEEDTYVYCDRQVCKTCKFNCKRGFTLYAYCNLHGLWMFEK